jgi:hypothetical protein
VGGRSITGHIVDRDDFVTGTQLAHRRFHSGIGLNAPAQADLALNAPRRRETTPGGGKKLGGYVELGDDMGCDEKWPEKDPPVPPDPTGTGTITGDVLRSLVFAGVFILIAYFIVEERDYARPLRV